MLTVLLLLVALFLFSRIRKTLPHRFTVYALTWLCLALLLLHIIANRFTSRGIDESVIYYAQIGLQGAGLSEYTGLIGASIVLVIAISAALFWYIFKEWGIRPNPIPALVMYGVLLAAWLANPGIADLYRLRAVPDNDNFYNYYRVPQPLTEPDEPRNLVFIYAEGLEHTYFDETLFPGLITHLRRWEAQSTYFTDVDGAPGTIHTIGGIVGGQLGLPLASGSGGNAMSGVDQFMPAAIGLGDVLRDKGYSLSFLGGASLEFGGKGAFFETHGFEEVLGREDLLQRLPDPSYRTGWGLYDDTLLALIYERYEQLAQLERPFGLFTLTLDTHHPDGHPSKSCDDIKYQDGANSMLNAVACSDFLIGQLIDQIAASPWASDTVIVVASDHIGQPNTATDLLEQGTRRNLFMIIEPNQESARRIDTSGSTYDIGSTVLGILGYTTDLGLGRDLRQDTARVNAERAYVTANVWGWFQSIVALWQFPTIEHSITILPDDEVITIDDREFLIPSLIIMDDALATQFRFDFDSQLRLTDLRAKLAEGQRFVMVNECDDSTDFNILLDEVPLYCLSAGNGMTDTLLMPLMEPLTFSAEQIIDLTEPEKANEYDIRFDDELQLENVWVSVNSAETVATIGVQWHVLSQPTSDHTVFFHLLDGASNLRAQLDQPMGSDRPTSTWTAGESYYEEYAFELPENLPAGTYTLRVGMYDWPSLAHLPIDKTDEQHIQFGSVTIGQTEASQP